MSLAFVFFDDTKIICWPFDTRVYGRTSLAKTGLLVLQYYAWQLLLTVSSPLSSNRQHSEIDDCLEDKREDY